MRRRSLLMLGFALAATPALAGYVQNEFWANNQLGALAPPLPPQTSVIGSRLGGGDTRCTELVARVLATTLPRNHAARFVAQGSSRPVDIAWSAPDGFWTWHSGQPHRVEERALPTSVDKLLTSYAFLPRGVHRFVVYREAALPHHIDPRCWGAT